MRVLACFAVDVYILNCNNAKIGTNSET